MTTKLQQKDGGVVHLRIPPAIHAAIGERAKAERRTWTQMALIILEDAAAEFTGSQLPPKKVHAIRAYR